MRLFLLTIWIITSTASGQSLIDKQNLTGKIGYYCSPCGCEYDDDFFDPGGSCPACNMSLHAAYEGKVKARAPLPGIVVGMLLFDGADIMDVTGPWSVFSHSGFEVITFAKSKESVTLSGGLTLKPDFSLETLPAVNVLVFPGSGLAETNPGDEKIRQFILDTYQQTPIVFSVCSGAFFLAEAGVLAGKDATTFASMIPMLKNYPEVNALDNVKYTDNGKVVTSGGLSSGIDAAFHVVSKLRGAGFAQDVANTMEYPRNLKYDYARSQLADNFLFEIRSVVRLFTTDYLDSQGDINSWKYTFALDEDMSAEESLAVVKREIEKNESWVPLGSEKNRLSGTITHPSLGDARITLQIAAREVTLSAERIQKYTTPSY